MFSLRRGISVLELMLSLAVLSAFGVIFLAVLTHKSPPLTEITISVERTELDKGVFWIFDSAGAPYQVCASQWEDSLRMFGRLKEHHSYKVKIDSSGESNTPNIPSIREVVQEVE